ncbi:glycosyltransferase family 2 protein [Leeuwenhoekiella sp. A2]|uniref:glycosyltransferase family 2 protein n=1 Tax=Leeuwenhoekiella sp. A2 TaxID=3141460 RepID=UPI003A810BB7
MKYSPILLFVYNRLSLTRKTIEALQKNFLANCTDLYIFSDGPRKNDIEKVVQVRTYLQTIKGFKRIKVYESKINKGLAASIVEGVTKIIAIEGQVIVLEDDLLTSPDFLTFMNQALDFYKEEYKVFSVSGFTMPIQGLESKNIYFTQRASSWGWATWKDRWNVIDWEVRDYENFKNSPKQRRAFNKMGSDLSNMLKKQMQGEINSWAIRWCYHQFKHGLYSVYPTTSKIQNIGLSDLNATHTNEKFNRFKTILQTNKSDSFIFSNNIVLDTKVIKQFVKPYSLLIRIKYKLLNKIFSGFSLNLVFFIIAQIR